MLVRGVQRFPLRNSSPEKPGRPSSGKDPTIVNSNRRWQNELRGIIATPGASSSRSRSPSPPGSRRDFQSRDELDALRRQNTTLSAREMCSRDELKAMVQHCQNLEDSREMERNQREAETRVLRADKERAETELEEVLAQRDLLWTSHSTLQTAVERLESQVQLHQDVIAQLRERNTELETPHQTPRQSYAITGMSSAELSPGLSAVMQQLISLLKTDPHRVINELCGFPVGAAVRLLQKDVLPHLPIDAAVSDRIQMQLLDVHSLADLQVFKEKLLKVVPCN